MAEIAAAAVDEPKRILDACAAPGGKTRVLALRHPGAEIVAADSSEKRLGAMRARLEKEPAAAAIKTVVADMTVAHVKAGEDGASPLEGEFDLVLLVYASKRRTRRSCRRASESST